MVMYRVVKTGGKQYLVKDGMEITVDLIDSEKGKKVELETLLKFDDEGKTFELGAPFLKDKVTAEVVDNVLGEKIRIARFKAKSRERKVRGFRSKLTKLKIIKV
ncbi:50S ribosomal protein L21 [Candidatus Roizmanbacteria bacterium CG22_combo_CG10-13_8_21_14_all_34_12]|uniref:Large ribosomal subunit protein bL21 n=1 Tax=Candidatus Roizmanbacteria bacterium CG22_combo_CG10-13_8_21_14_all_34_12 TaxID=1974860 RepID=A0A2H0C0V3_9BACT|nr:MAG: 50S ribosomal protein L21 [Candidatus Roizmanbacteria bacterium CG22_combo_CG10-13_8_21_14_all_34_12]